MGENSLDNPGEENTVFVTVGTTYFDELIRETNKLEFHKILRNLGYNKLVVQFGNGNVTPSVPLVDGTSSFSTFLPLPLVSFRYKSSLDAEFENAKFVISHGGAGTCMKALDPPGRRRLLIVINTSLMGNHQEELAFALANGKHALVTTPESILNLLCNELSSENELEAFKPFDVSHLLDPSIPPLEAGFRPFRRGDPERLLTYLDHRLG